ncbi:MAG: ATP-binding protein [Solirubrobacteraceae bacterium]
MRAQATAARDLALDAHPLRKGVIRRLALVEDLTEATGAALALIVAPPGYGKSTLLADWAEHDERQFVWLTPARGDLATILRTGAPGGLVSLVRRLRKRYDGFVLVIDDAEAADGPQLGELVESALAELPAGSTITTPCFSASWH